MINHGLALYKPGESDLGTAMRLWIVNRHCWKQGSSSINDRIAVKNVTQDPLFSTLYSNSTEDIQSLKCTHAKVLGYDSSIETSSWSKFRSVKKSISHKQCFSCAKLGHHSVLFDLIWMKKCPIHQESLSKHCPICYQPWPSISKLSTRACKLCGAHLSIDELVSEDAFNSKAYREQVPSLLKFFDTDIKFYQAYRKYFVNFPAEREDSLSISNAFPSLLSHYSSDEKLCNELKKLDVQISNCYVKSFKLAPTSDDRDLKPDIALMEHSRKQVFEIALNVLFNEADHELGSCKREPLFGHFSCTYCETWRMLIKGFQKSLLVREDRILIHYSPPYTRSINVSDPGLVTSLYDTVTGSYFKVPKNIQAIIYRTDLWQCVVKLFSQIEFFLDQYAAHGLIEMPSMERQKNYINHQKHHFTPFYFVKRCEECQLVFPEEFRLKRLTGTRIRLERFTEEE